MKTLFIFLSVLPCLAQLPNQASGTLDGGKMSYIGIPAAQNASCFAGGSYSAKTYSVLPTEALRCWAMVWNTADGQTNKNPTIFIGTPGGNIAPLQNSGNASNLWLQHFDAVNGTVTSFLACAVEGIVTANCPWSSVHYNLIVPTYTLSAVGQLNSALNNTNLGPGQVNNINGSYWPQSADVSVGTPYVIHFATGEKIEVTAQTGAQGANYMVTGFVRGFGGTTAATHLTTEYFWVEDATGVSGAFPSSICDVMVAAMYFDAHAGNGTVPGVPGLRFGLGWSNGAYLLQMANRVGHSLLANNTACAASNDQPDSGLNFQKVALISTKDDNALVGTNCSWLTGAGQAAAYIVAGGCDNTEPQDVVATTGWLLNGGAPSYASINLAAPYTIAGIVPTTPSAGYLAAHAWDPQFCQKGNSSLCAIPIDPSPSPEYKVWGDQDTDVGGVLQLVGASATFVQTVANAQAGASHTANFDVNGGLGTGCTGNSQACSNGAVMTAIMAFFAGPCGTAAPCPAASPINGGGIF